MSWLTASGDLKSRTRDLYASLRDLLILPTLGPAAIAAITPRDVRDWHTDLGESTGPTARAQSYRLLRAILNQAVRDQMIVTSPTVVVPGGTLRAEERGAGHCGADRDHRRVGSPRYRTLVLAGAWSGLRFGELAALRRRDVDLAAPSFTVTRTMHRVQGDWIVAPPKSEAGRRTVRLPPHLHDDLEEQLRAFVGPSPDALVFATASGSPLALSNWSSIFSRARARAGRPDLRFHDLRHTGATLAAQAGGTHERTHDPEGPRIRTVAYHTGHTSAALLRPALRLSCCWTADHISAQNMGKKRPMISSTWVMSPPWDV